MYHAIAFLKNGLLFKEISLPVLTNYKVDSELLIFLNLHVIIILILFGLITFIKSLTSNPIFLFEFYHFDIFGDVFCLENHIYTDLCFTGLREVVHVCHLQVHVR